MPPLDILKPPYHNVDPLALGNQGAVAIDVDFDELGSMHKRPGLWPFWRLGVMNGVDGLFWWPDKQQLIVVIAGRVLAFASLTAAPTEATTTECRLAINQPVQFASLGAQLFMVNGSRMVRYLGTGKCEYMNEADDPGEVDYIAAYNGRIIANERGASRGLFTEYVPPTDTTRPKWVLTDDLTPEANSDPLTSILNYGSEILLGGPRSLEFWQDVGSSPNPFVRSSFMLEFGVASPNSMVIANGAAFWMTQDRRIMSLTGHNPTIISLPIEDELKALRNPGDCKAFLLDHYVVFTFPTDNITWVFDYISANWVRWGFWNSDVGAYERYLGQNAVYVPAWSTWFVGGKYNGQLLVSSPNMCTDLGNPIRSAWVSAIVDHGGHNWKLSAELSLKFKNAGWKS
jgi:hypothetical protein